MKSWPGKNVNLVIALSIFAENTWRHCGSKKREDFKIAIWRLNGWLLWTVFCHCRTSLEGLLEQYQTITAASSPMHQSFENISIRTIRACTVIMFRCLFLHKTFSYKITLSLRTDLHGENSWWRNELRKVQRWKTYRSESKPRWEPLA